MNYKILIAEDDNDINNLLSEILTQAGYDVEQAYSGTEARRLFDQSAGVRTGARSTASSGVGVGAGSRANTGVGASAGSRVSVGTGTAASIRGAAETGAAAAPTLILLDLMLPGMTGEELIAHIRQSCSIPIIVLSAKETGPDKINALRLGADDYITKPFDGEELLARIEANIRRIQFTPETASLLSHHDLLMDRDSRKVTAAGMDISLTAREFAILELLMLNPKKVFTKANIYSSVWNEEFFGDDNTVNVHISNLRSKLQGDYIQTVWGIGFKLQE